jgi:hypothetical protein
LVSVPLIADRLVDLYPLPVGVKLIRNYKWQRCADDGAHLRAMSDDVDGPILLNPDKHIGVKRGAVCIGLTVGRVLMPQYRREISDGEDQCSCPKHSLEEPTPTYILD